jgi:hypothetical protein
MEIDEARDDPVAYGVNGPTVTAVSCWRRANSNNCTVTNNNSSIIYHLVSQYHLSVSNPSVVHDFTSVENTLKNAAQCAQRSLAAQ